MITKNVGAGDAASRLRNRSDLKTTKVIVAEFGADVLETFGGRTAICLKPANDVVQDGRVGLEKYSPASIKLPGL